MATFIHNIPAPGTYVASTDPNTNDVFVIEKGIGTVVIDGFIGIGPGASPSAAVKAKMDVLKFMGEGLDAKNMILTVNGSDLVIQFEDPSNPNHVIADTMVVLTNFSLYNLDNIPASGPHAAIGNILFDGQNEGPGKMFQSSGMHDNTQPLFADMMDNYDVANSAPMNSLFNKSTVSFLSEGNDTINNPSMTSGHDVINGMGGNDTIYGGNGDDVIRGGKGNDKIFGQDGKDSLYGDEGKDTIYGGGNSDTIYGGTGDDVIYGDYGNKAPMSSPSPETKTVTQKVTGDADAWADAGFELKAFKADGSVGVVTYGNAQEGIWLGVQGETTPGPLYDDEIGYDPKLKGSEKLVVDFNKDVHKAVVDLTYFYGVKSGADGNITIDNHKVNEVLHWEAYDDGVKVGSGDIINNQTTNPNFSFTIQLSGGKVFDTVEFSAKPYDNAKTSVIDNGQGGYTHDSSDFGIKAITICYKETVPPQPNPETEPGAADVIFGNAGNDQIHGNQGDDIIHGDDLEHQASYGSQDVHLGSHAMDQSPSN
ncbi:MAG TPA: calcium-binding protein, partial [Candidatus Nitrosotenuis sp.]|nr:calcium-binding protein [Candidatus Nitrosotenuis sp.]